MTDKPNQHAFGLPVNARAHKSPVPQGAFPRSSGLPENLRDCMEIKPGRNPNTPHRYKEFRV